MPHNPAYQEELEEMGEEALDLLCRRYGLSRSGGKPAQVQRLIALRAYTDGDSKPEPVAGPRLLPLLQVRVRASWTMSLFVVR